VFRRSERSAKLWIASLAISWNTSLTMYKNNMKGNKTMEAKSMNIISRNGIFLWIALGTGLLLMIPLVAMQFTSEVNWTLSDFILMGVLIFTVSSLFVLVARKVQKKNRLAVGAAFLLGFLWLWAELAVGVFTTWGS
jgi:uncharacterized membrane protein